MIVRGVGSVHLSASCVGDDSLVTLNDALRSMEQYRERWGRIHSDWVYDDPYFARIRAPTFRARAGELPGFAYFARRDALDVSEAWLCYWACVTCARRGRDVSDVRRTLERMHARDASSS